MLKNIHTYNLKYHYKKQNTNTNNVLIVKFDNRSIYFKIKANKITLVHLNEN